MYELIKAFAAITLRRQGPEDLPASGLLLGLSMLAYLLAQLPTAASAFGTADRVLVSMVLDLGLEMAFPWLLLWLIGKPARYPQTLTALLGTGALLTVAATPLYFAMGPPTAEGPAPALPAAAFLAVQIWSLVVAGHILARALSRPFMVGLLAAIGFFFASWVLMFELLPGPA